MGYTHYWDSKGITPKQAVATVQSQSPEWLVLQNFARAVVDTFRKQGGHVSFEAIDDVIRINGATEESEYEDFYITPVVRVRNLCKTERKEYDTVVVAMLVGLAATGAYGIASDGKPDDLRAGLQLALQCLPELRGILDESGISVADFKASLSIFIDEENNPSILELAAPTTPSLGAPVKKLGVGKP
jgi:hypothetical protein